MKKTARILVLASLLFGGVSCSNFDGFDALPNQATVSMCVIGRQMNTLCLVTDFGEKLLPTVSLDSTKYLVGSRYRATYQEMVLSNSSKSLGTGIPVVVSNLQPVLVNDIKATDISPVYDQSGDLIWLMCKPWFGGGYLNFEFSFWSSISDVKHSVNLFLDSIVGKKAYLTFAHDAKNDQPLEKVAALASFRIRSQMSLTAADSLTVWVQEETAPARPKAYSLALRDTLVAE